MPGRSTYPRLQHPLYLTVIFVIAQWAAMLGLWLLLVGNSTRPEILLGLAAGFLAAGIASLLEAASFARFAPHFGELVQAWRLPWYLITGTWEIFEVLGQQMLAKRTQSLVRSVRFDPGGDDAHSAARRALAIALTTVPPNFVVIGIDRAKRLLIFHQVKRSKVPLMTQKLGAKP